MTASINTLSPATSGRCVRFVLRTCADASALPRVLELFALRNLVPDHVLCRLEPDGENRGGLAVEVAVDPVRCGLTQPEQEVLTAKLGQIVTVSSVQYIAATPARPPSHAAA